MKLKIKVRLLKGAKKLEVNGDWIDLASRFRTEIDGNVKLVDLGICMEMPKGYEGILVARSSTGLRKNAFNPNGIGVIDNAYCGNEDIIRIPLKSINGDKAILKAGDRIAQLKVVPSQHATPYQKIKNLFYNGIEIQYVDNMSNPNRGGFGHSDKKE